MQSGGGQYGVPDQFVVQRPAPPHLFTLAHEIPLPVPGHGHHHLQQQQQQHHQPQHHQPQHHHPQHQPQHHHQHSQPGQHPQHLQQQQQPQQLPQHTHQQHAQQQQQQHPQHAHPHAQQHQQQQQQQQQQAAMVQQLGLGPDSPEVPSPVGSRPSPTNYKPRDSLGDDDGAEEEGRITGGNRWPRQETLALIKIRSEMDANFRDSGLKGPLWEDVSRRLGELGYRRSSKKCKEKFENVHKYYKKTKDGRAGRQDGKSYRFFSQLEALYGGGGGSGQHGDGGNLMLTPGGGQAAIGGGAEGNISLQRPADNSSGMHLSSDSEDDYDDPGDGEDLEKSRKRKRRDAKMLSKMVYFEGFLKKFVEKQETMQRKFLDALERRDQERLVREESWKRQEMARISREHELRAQEHALSATRDAALVAFLQKVTGQTLTIPPVALSQALAVVPSEVPQADLEHQEKESFDPNSKRWPRAEVQALIRLRSQMEPRFQEAGPKGPLWEEICTGMTCLGFSRNAKRCKEKWENINKYFRKTKETHRKRPDNAKTCPYFHQLDLLYRKGVLGTPISKLKLDENSDDLADHPGSNREDSENDHGRDAEEMMGAVVPAGDGPSGASTSNGGATHFFSSSGNGSSGDRGPKKGMTS